MKKNVSIFLVSTILSLGEVFPIERKDEAYLIRKAFIDVLGIVPTITELEWYCVYNKDSYSCAVDWLLKHPRVQHKSVQDIADLKNKLYSLAYKSAAKEALTQKQINNIIYYLAGADNQTLTLREAKLKLILHAKMDTVSDMDAVDYLALELMGRVTSVAEANSLLRVLREAPKDKREEDVWLDLFDSMLTLEDITHK